MKFVSAFANKMTQKHINRNFQAKNSCWSERGQLPILRVIWDLSNCRQTCEPPNYWSASTILIAEMRIGTTLVFALASGVYIGLSSLPWQVVAWPSMVEWKSGQVDGATRHKGDPTPVHNLHITTSSIWQLAKTQNNKVRGQKTFSAICSEANASIHTGHIFFLEFYLPFQENQGWKLEKTERCDSPRSFAALRNKIAVFCRLATFSFSSVISIVITIILISLFISWR